VLYTNSRQSLAKDYIYSSYSKDKVSVYTYTECLYAPWTPKYSLCFAVLIQNVLCTLNAKLWFNLLNYLCFSLSRGFFDSEAFAEAWLFGEYYVTKSQSDKNKLFNDIFNAAIINAILTFSYCSTVG